MQQKISGISGGGRQLPHFFTNIATITPLLIKNTTKPTQADDRQDSLGESGNETIEGSDIFLVDIEISPDNRIVVEIDSMTSIGIDDCVKINNAIEANFDRNIEDYELEVGSAGLTAPFKIKAQYIKNVGNPVEVLTTDGRKLKGDLKEANDDSSPSPRQPR